MTKVYIVRYGCYSSQGISGVFSTKEKAAKYCDIHNKLYDDCCEEYWIDERVLDEDEIQEGTEIATYSIVTINLEDGFGSDWEKHKAGDTIYEGEECRIFTETTVTERHDNVLWVYSSLGADHAEKVAIEKYQIYTKQKLENGEI